MRVRKSYRNTEIHLHSPCCVRLSTSTYDSFFFFLHNIYQNFLRGVKRGMFDQHPMGMEKVKHLLNERKKKEKGNSSEAKSFIGCGKAPNVTIRPELKVHRGVAF